MASIYRRKQDAILGLDNSSFIATSDTLANAVARYRGESEGHTDKYDEESVPSRIESSRDYARSLYEQPRNIDDEYEVSDLEDSDEDERLRGRRPSKADHVLGRDTISTSNISSKAQKLLGITKPLDTVPEPRSPVGQQSLHSIGSDTESIAPKALRTLGIGPRQTRPNTAHERATQYTATFEADEFKRLLASGFRPSPHIDNNSSTDVSSQLSRESTISWRTETPRSSQEVHLDDVRWRNGRSMAFAKRKDSLFDPNAVLTEPFSPLSTETPLSKSTPHDFSFELPGDIPDGYYGSEKKDFIFELPAADPAPIFEMPANVPDVVELPGDLVVVPSAEKHVIRGIPHPDIAELYSSSPPKISILPTKAVGESSPSKIYPSPQRTMAAPIAGAVSVPQYTFEGNSPTSIDVAREIKRRPTVHGLQTELASRSRVGDVIMKSKSIEFPGRSSQVLVTPVTPLSPNSSLGLIASKAATGSRRQASLSEAKPTTVRSKFNPDTQQPRRDTSTESRSSVKQAIIDERDDDETPKAEAFVNREAINDEYPDSPVTGHLAGHPAFNKTLPLKNAQINKPLPIPGEEEKIFLNPEETSTNIDTVETLIPAGKESVTSVTLSNLKKQGFM